MTLGLVVPRASAEARCQQGLGQNGSWRILHVWLLSSPGR